MKKIIIVPYLFDEILIIALSKEWINQFKKMPQFIVKINSKNKLIIESLDEVAKKT